MWTLTLNCVQTVCCDKNGSRNHTVWTALKELISTHSPVRFRVISLGVDLCIGLGRCVLALNLGKLKFIPVPNLWLASYLWCAFSSKDWLVWTSPGVKLNGQTRQWNVTCFNNCHVPGSKPTHALNRLRGTKILFDNFMRHGIVLNFMFCCRNIYVSISNSNRVYSPFEAQLFKLSKSSAVSKSMTKVDDRGK